MNNSNTFKQEGNDIIIYPTSVTTATSSREAPENTVEKTAIKKPGYFKKIRRLGALTKSYFSQLFNKKKRQDQSPPSYQKRKSYNNKRMRQQEFIWCYRPVGTSAAFKCNHHWREFEKKNQIELSRQLGLLDHHHNNSFEIQDKHIFDDAVVTIMLKEGIAFVLDPEWSKPIVYEVTCRPKLHWYQEIYMRHRYRKMLKSQHKAALRRSTPVLPPQQPGK